MSTGWICPKCNAVMAPHVSVCINCKGNQSIPLPEHWKLPLKNYPESTHIDLCEHDVLKISGRCPKCNTVMAAHISSCVNCNGNQQITVSSETIHNKYFESLKLCPHGLPVKFNSCHQCIKWVDNPFQIT